ncbi:hypothetical protein Q8F55_005618 [Vanrija albida]|uniref:TPX2 C-terminal domain-containing protein n=1 Tax=Vanrija albida TaxID=181172 RepID=A0ABR3Q245_9TREE
MSRRRPQGAPTPAPRRATETPFGKVQPRFDGFELANSSWGEEDSLSLPVIRPSPTLSASNPYTSGLDLENTHLVMGEFDTFEETVFTGRGERVSQPAATPDRKGKRKAESPELPATVTKRRARSTLARQQATPKARAEDDVFGTRVSGPSSQGRPTQPPQRSTVDPPARQPVVESIPTPLQPPPTPVLSFNTAPAPILAPSVATPAPPPPADTTAASSKRSGTKRNPLLGKGKRFTVSLQSGGELTTREARAGRVSGAPSSRKSGERSSRKARAANESAMPHTPFFESVTAPAPSMAASDALQQDVVQLAMPVGGSAQQLAASTSAVNPPPAPSSSRSNEVTFPPTMAIDLPNGYVGQGRQRVPKPSGSGPTQRPQDAARLPTLEQQQRDIRPLPVKAAATGAGKQQPRQPVAPVAAKPRALLVPTATASSSGTGSIPAAAKAASAANTGRLRKMVALPKRSADPAAPPAETNIKTAAQPPPLPPRPIPRGVAVLQSSASHIPSPAPSADTLPGRREDWEDSGVMDVDADDSGDTPEWFNAPLPTAEEKATAEAPQPKAAVTTASSSSTPLTPAALAWRPEPAPRTSSSGLVSRLSSSFNFIASAFSPSPQVPPVEPPEEKDVMPMVEIRHSPVTHRIQSPAAFEPASQMVSSAGSTTVVVAAPPPPVAKPVRAQPAGVERKRATKSTSERRDGALQPSSRQPAARPKAVRSSGPNLKGMGRQRGATAETATAGSRGQSRTAPTTRPSTVQPAPTARPVPTSRTAPVTRPKPAAGPAAFHVSRPRVTPAPELPFYGPPALAQAKFEAYRDSLASRSPARVSLRNVERAIDIEARRRYWEEVWRSDTEGQATGTPALAPLPLQPGAAASPDPRAEKWRDRYGRESHQRADQRRVFDSRRKELEQLKKDEAAREKAALARITAEVVKELRNAPRARG